VRSDGRDAFVELCRDEYAAVVRSAYLITGSREDALDLAQETFARAYEQWRTVSQMDRPAAWLQRVVANLAISSHRRRRLAARKLAMVPRESPVRLDDSSSFTGLDALTPAQRAVIVLRYYADLSVDQTASALGKRPGTVRALSSQALGRLRDGLHQEVRGEP
jgi:DNA-directed RNA polymerase specialized sigma24 family protein